MRLDNIALIAQLFVGVLKFQILKGESNQKDTLGILKFMYSEKAIKFCEIATVDLTFTT